MTTKKRASGRRPRTLSKRANAQKAAQRRRAAKAALRENAFQALAAGWSVRQIADVRKVSVRTIQREIERAVAERRLNAPDRFIHQQIARLTNALRVRLDRGELAAVAPLLKVVAALDRYHRPIGPWDPFNAPTANLALPTPPLALTHAASRSDTANEAT